MTPATPAGIPVVSPVPLLLIAHGSRDPRSGAVIERLVARIADTRPDLPVAAAYLEHRGRRPLPVARDLTGGTGGLVAVPLLLTSAYHGRVDVPAVVAGIRADLPDLHVRLGRVLGGDDAVTAALDDRLAAANVSTVDGLVLAAAGTRDVAARRGIARLARRYGARHGLPCLPAYAAAGDRDVPTAVAELRASGARRIAVLSYFLAPGRLHDRIVAGARDSGAVAVTEPFGSTAGIVTATLTSYGEALRSVDSQRIRQPVLVG
ncbi:sirohydrochlorin chelatase [Actinocatenispora rupis]|uniref:Cobalamin biosynthesis protein n=1 Tax=Actinocatenispora rupis TaxID=519421 RepID=A0A8J3J5L4_9ACTN|nr:cobalamin biosynthesis protein [Actinocatenispora rupis]